MKKLKIAVYAICKNEEKNLVGWIKNIKDADQIVVLDTGSTDKSISILKENKIDFYEKKYNNFRFDQARNDALDLVNKDIDICISMDIDERFVSNWREIIEKVWKEDTKMLSYRYTWSFKEDGSEGTVFYISKIHARNGFIWVHPVHEVLKSIDGNEKIVLVKELKLYHYPDKNKSRGQYLPLLELSVQEDPEDDRNMHYLGREYMFHQKYDKAIETLKKHLHLKSATWKDERAASYRYIARCYLKKNELNKAIEYYYYAIIEANYLREAYIELAYLLFNEKNYYGTLYFVEEALKIKERSLTYINEPFSFDHTPYDLASVALFYLKQYEKSLEYIDAAIEISPNNSRLLKNKEIILDKIN